MDPEEKRELEAFRETVDVSVFVNKPYQRRVEKPWGFEYHFVPDDMPYMGKLLHVNEGELLSLQVHDRKQESWIRMYGNISVVLESVEGDMEEIELGDFQCYTCHVGQRHTIKGGKGGGAVIEFSGPESGKTYRLEDKYGRTQAETAEERERRNKGEKLW